MQTFAADDTIVAVATPEGRAGLGVVRISGADAPAIAQAMLSRRSPLQPRRATFTRILAPSGSSAAPIDEVVVTWFAAPASYTGEHVVEIAAHGSPVVLRAIVASAMQAGARLARPGEFTLRAYLNGRCDLVQAEAVADLIEAATPTQARAAFDQLQGTLTQRIAAIEADLFDLVVRLEASIDFPDEGYHFIDAQTIGLRLRTLVETVDQLLADAARGRMIREGATVVFAGRTNVGKSRLFNALLGSERAIVTDVAGTTRDLIAERMDLDGVAVTLVDTAGVRDAVDAVEREGVTRGEGARRAADLVLAVFDGGEPLQRDDREVLRATDGMRRLLVVNKCDRMPDGEFERWRAAVGDVTFAVSAATREGLETLRDGIVRTLTGAERLHDTVSVTNERHIALLRSVREDLSRASEAAAAGPVPEEFLLADLQSAREGLEEVVGKRASDAVLDQVFARFCIGK